jgi:hypothetical protein
MALCEQASREQNPLKLSKLIAELLRLTDEKQQRVDLLASTCVICGIVVPLETAKTDGHGKTVHGDCYTKQIATEKP